jgi:hypothetical protein
MTEFVNIVYVGNKPHAFDNVAKSGKSWEGKGAVQQVTDKQAKILLKYPDQWALENESDQAVVDTPNTVESVGENGEAVDVDEADLKKPLERMTKPELFAFAKDKWGKDLDVSLSKKLMIDQIEEWLQTIGE